VGQTNLAKAQRPWGPIRMSAPRTAAHPLWGPQENLLIIGPFSLPVERLTQWSLSEKCN
jgi:hypothetical protein